jgi:uncharacterized membrane protein
LREARGGAAAPTTPPAAGWPSTPETPRPRPDLEAEYARTIGRELHPLAAVSRGASLVFAQPAQTIGISLLIIAMMIGAGFVPCIGSVLQLAVMGPLTATWYAWFLRHIRGQAATLDDVFTVFSSPDLLHMVATHVIVSIVTMLVVLPVIVGAVFLTIGTAAATAAVDPDTAPLVALHPFGAIGPLIVLGVLVAIAVGLYISTAFMFAPILVLDRGHAFWPAMRLSQRVVNRRLLPMIGLVVLAMLIGLAGLLALCVGLVVALPIVMASYAHAYEDLFGERAAA